jgi:KipI family sensor histidine kinase inhibitor
MKINDNIRLEVAGENALILYFSGDEQSSAVDVSHKVHQAAQLIQLHLSADIIDVIPSYASILVVFNLLDIDHHRLRNKLKNILTQEDNVSIQTGKVIELPAYYSVESGIDLARIAKHASLSIEQVIALHQAQAYQVYAIGFAPGFAYLGDVDERIAMPRLATPRLKVPKGAIAIADRQTAVYPEQSPGGWNIIGLCPVDMFNSKAEPHMPVAVGDTVKFVAISKEQYLKLGGKLPNMAEYSHD